MRAAYPDAERFDDPHRELDEAAHSWAHACHAAGIAFGVATERFRQALVTNAYGADDTPTAPRAPQPATAPVPQTAEERQHLEITREVPGTLSATIDGRTIAAAVLFRHDAARGWFVEFNNDGEGSCDQFVWLKPGYRANRATGSRT